MKRKRKLREGTRKRISKLQQSIYRVKAIVEDVDYRDRYWRYTLLDKLWDEMYPFKMESCRNIRMKRCRGEYNKYCVTFTALIWDTEMRYYQKDNFKLKKIK